MQEILLIQKCNLYKMHAHACVYACVYMFIYLYVDLTVSMCMSICMCEQNKKESKLEISKLN